jgi:hypothetical protein
MTQQIATTRPVKLRDALILTRGKSKNQRTKQLASQKYSANPVWFKMICQLALFAVVVPD